MSKLMAELEESEKVVGLWGCYPAVQMQVYQPCMLREGL